MTGTVAVACCGVPVDRGDACTCSLAFRAVKTRSARVAFPGTADSPRTQTLCEIAQTFSVAFRTVIPRLTLFAPHAGDGIVFERRQAALAAVRTRKTGRAFALVVDARATVQARRVC